MRHPLSVVGAVLATVGALLFLTFLVAELLDLFTNPYAGLLSFFLFPAIFVFGLLLIPVGAWLQRRRRLAGKPDASGWPKFDLNDPRQRRWTFFVVAATLVNIVIVSVAAYSGVEYMETPSFCGQVCHSVMNPEFTAHKDSTHSQVACVKCHVGPGASGFVQSKLTGMRQLISFTFNTHSRPVPAPVHQLNPARVVCEQCHWPEKVHGDKVQVIKEYGDDEPNTETITTLDVHVGGGNERLAIATGIHWHMNIANEVEYITTDPKRQVIPWVRVKDRQGNVREYLADGVSEADLAKGERRRMDCLDCHNRPAHTFDATPEKAVNRLLATGEMSKTLPFLRREAVAALTEKYATQAAGVDAISRRLGDFYQKNYKDIYAKQRADVDRAISATQRAFSRNIHPSMSITWGTYPNNIGHNDFPGCFRCHDESHKTKDGKTISQDCELCHKMR